MPTPQPSETKQHFMRRCVPYVLRERGTKSSAHAVAKCNGIWRQRDRVANARRRRPMRYDPTRTIMLRRKAIREVRRRFRSLLRAVKARLLGRVVLNYEPVQTMEQLEEFKQFVQAQVQQDLTGQANWLGEHIEESWMRGRRRSADDWLAGQNMPPQQKEFLRQSFLSVPIDPVRVEALASTAYTNLQGISAQVSTVINQVTTQGLIQGLSPHEIAAEITRRVGMLRRRAETIARTEMIRAHAEGQLSQLQNLGVEQVGVLVEWDHTGDDRVCTFCRDMGGTTYTIDEARGLIPAHPNCRCAWIPHVEKAVS